MTRNKQIIYRNGLWNDRLKSVSLLKGLAIAMVVFCHAAQTPMFVTGTLQYWFYNLSQYAQAGCQLFFVLSGLTIALSWTKKYENKSGGGRIPAFYRHRFAVIAPGVYAVIAVWLLLNLLASRFGFDAFFTPDDSPVSLVLSLLFLNGLFPSAYNSMYPGAWFVGTIMLFYLLFPFLWKGLKAIKADFRSTVCLAAAIGVFWSLAVGVCHDLTGMAAGYEDFLCAHLLSQLPVLLVGIALYFLWKKNRFRSVKVPFLKMLPLFALSYWLFCSNGILWCSLLLPTVTGFAFMYLVIGTERICSGVPKAAGRIAATLDKYSFAVFLIHPFFVWTLYGTMLLHAGAFPFPVAGTAFFACYVALSLALSCGTAVAMEKLVFFGRRLVRTAWKK